MNGDVVTLFLFVLTLTCTASHKINVALTELHGLDVDFIKEIVKTRLNNFQSKRQTNKQK